MTAIGYEKCPKCGSQPMSTFSSYSGYYLTEPHSVFYERITDQLRISCTICGHFWYEEPLDSRTEQDEEPDEGMLDRSGGG